MMMSMLLALLFTCLGVFGLGELGLSVYGSFYLSNPCLIIADFLEKKKKKKKKGKQVYSTESGTGSTQPREYN
jgi:hypothetical protein